MLWRPTRPSRTNTKNRCPFNGYMYHNKEKTMAPHSGPLAWKISWMEEPGRLKSMGSLRVRHDWVTSLSLFTFMHWRRKWQPTLVFFPGESQVQRSLVGCRLWGCTESTQLKRLSSSSSRITTNWKTMKEMEIPDHLTCLLRNLHEGQEATVITGHRTTDWFQIGKWVH